MTQRTTGPRGFTIIEMLVVIGIIAILLGLLLPALSGVQKRGKKTAELNYLRQVGLAWSMYANSNDDAAVPGFLSQGTQDRWHVTYKFPNGERIPPAGNFSYVAPERYDAIDIYDPANLAGPWTWRLMPYLDYAADVVRFYANEDNPDVLAMSEPDVANDIAQHPAFGYNGYYIGGFWARRQLVDHHNTGGSIDVPLARFTFATANTVTGAARSVNVVERSVSSIGRSSEVVVFCSAAHLEKGIVRQVPTDTPGSHLVNAPYLARTRTWGPSAGSFLGPQGTGPGATQQANQFQVFPDDGCDVPIGRYTGTAVVLTADGHTSQTRPLALFDQRLWVESAVYKVWEFDEGSQPTP